jgi:pyruvate formate lyase activating enzyme
MKEALFYSKGRLAGTVNCRLCGVRCTGIPQGGTGYCRVRENHGGKLFASSYGKACSVALDPVEKKPLFHFAPGSRCLSIATVGCNFRCLHCQNADISQEYGEAFGMNLSPEAVISEAQRQGAQGIAYTYTEPTVFYEYALDIMKLAGKAGLYNVWVSNGYTSPEAIRKAARYMDAVNVDVKGDNDFYKNVCMVRGDAPVYEALKQYRKAGVWTEITVLVIPGYNYNEEWIAGASHWIEKHMGPDTPLHFSAFFPQHRLKSAQPTSLEMLLRCREIAVKEGLRWVYVGNVSSSKYENTICPECGGMLIGRDGYRVLSMREKCGNCKKKVPIAGKKWMKA